MSEFDSMTEAEKIAHLAETARVEINTLEGRAKKLLRERDESRERNADAAPRYCTVLTCSAHPVAGYLGGAIHLCREHADELRRQVVRPDPRTPMPPEVLEALEEAGKDDCGRYELRRNGDRNAHRRDAIRAALPHLRADEVMTREEWAADLEVAFAETGDALDAGIDVWLRGTSGNEPEARFRAQIGEDSEYAYGSDPIAALEALAASAPCPHEDAEWTGIAYHWRNRQNVLYAYCPGEECPDCGEKLPDLPHEDAPDDVHTNSRTGGTDMLKLLLQLLGEDLALGELTDEAIEAVSDRLVDDYRKEIMAAYADAVGIEHRNPVLYAARRFIRHMLKNVT